MTEKEIVEYLKNNRTKGIGFIFMPREVRKWITSNKSKLDFYDSTVNNWVNASNFNIHYPVIYSLPEDFKFEEKPQEGGWFEYKIDKNGNFYSADADDKDGHYYHWSEWNTCLANNKDNLIGFGGWQYENSYSWYMTPQIKSFDTYSCFTAPGDEIPPKPAIPTKIRFWREAR